MVKAAREARTSDARTTVDPAEVARFAALADEWWNPHGKMRPLHKFNPVRLAYIRDRICERFGRDAKSLDEFRYEDFEIAGYEAHPHIAAPVAV